MRSKKSPWEREIERRGEVYAEREDPPEPPDALKEQASSLKSRLKARREARENVREKALAEALSNRLFHAGVLSIEVPAGLYRRGFESGSPRSEMLVTFGVSALPGGEMMHGLVHFGIGPDDDSAPCLYHDDDPVSVDVAAQICLDLLEKYAEERGLV